MTVICVNEATPVNLKQFAGQALPYIIDVSAAAVNAWSANSFIAANALIRPTIGNETGFLYQNGPENGQTGPLEPAWATTGTVKDGSLTWAPLTPPAAGEDSISSVTWTQANPPDGTLTITSVSNTTLTATAKLGGGTSGQVYTVIVTITMISGAEYVVKIILTIV